MINSYGLLKSFDSNSINIIDFVDYGDKKCILYSNGRVVYIKNNEQLTLHIDTLYCTGFGFVQSDDNIIRVYTSILGIVTIYLVEINDIINISLPSASYHVRKNTIKLIDDVFYTVAGPQIKITSQSMIDNINANIDETVNVDGVEYAILNNGLFYSTISQSTTIRNIGRSFVNHPVFDKYNIIDYDLNSSITTVICKDGTILYSNNYSSVIDSPTVKCEYYPGISIELASPELSINVVDYPSLKMVDSYIDENSDIKSKYIRFFTHCPDSSIRYCDIYDNNTAVIHYSNSEFYSNRKPIVISNISLSSDYYPNDTTFNNPDRVTFSRDGSKVVISRGKYGLILVDDTSYRFIYKSPGFRQDCEVRSGIFADDGYLYIALRGTGYVLRNLNKDDYSSFFDIVSSSMIIIDGRLDEDTEVSNIISTDNGIMFFCKGRHESITSPGTFISNNGLYHYDSRNTKLTEIESFIDTFVIGDRRLFYTNREILIHEGNFTIAKMDRFTFQKEYLGISPITNCKVWDIFKKMDSYVMYVSTPIDSTNYTNSVIYVDNNLIQNTVQINVTSSILNLLELSENTHYSPYISHCETIGLYSLILFRNSDSTIVLHSIHLSGNRDEKFIEIPFKMSIDSNFNVKVFSNYIEFSVTKPLFKYEKNIVWKYYIDTCSLEETIFDLHENLNTSSEDTIICKSLSRNNLRISEGFISGDNCVSDFGADNTRFNPYTYYATRSFYTIQSLDGSLPRYFDRISNEEIFIENICSLKTGYTFIIGLGIGRDDCKVYLAYDTVGDIRCIWEYATNNNDIVDIFVLGNNSNINDIDDPSLLGSVSPGSTPFNNVDNWYIGDINNNVVGIKFTRDGLGAKTSIIDTIVYIGIKDKYVFAPSNMSDIEIPTILQIIDDSLLNFKMYSETFGQKYISVAKDDVKFIDIFSRLNVENYIGRNVITVLSDNLDIDSDKYFKTKSSIVPYENTFHTRYMMDAIKLINYPYTRVYGNCIELMRDNDDFHICSMVKNNEFQSINFASFDTSYQGVDKIVLFLEFDMNYGNLKDDAVNFHLLRGLRISSDNGLNYSLINFTKDPMKNNVYYSEISVGLINLSNFIISLSNEDCDTHTTRFRIWSNSFNGTTVAKTTINPLVCTDVDMSQTPIYGYSYNDMRVPYSTTPINTANRQNIISLYDGCTICAKFKIDTYGMLISHSFNLFSIGDYKVFLQLASIDVDNLNINCNIQGSAISPFSFVLVKDLPIICRIKRDGNLLSIILIQDSTEFVICTNLSLSGVSSDCSIFEFFFGEIQNISMFNDIDAFSNENCDYIGDNVYGRVVSIIRDYYSGTARILVSPSSSGILKDKGILEYEMTDIASTLVKYHDKNIVNDLRYGELGFFENSAFSIICYKNVSGDFVNIFTRKQPESLHETTTAYIKSVSDDFIVDMNGNRIVSSEIRI